MDLSVKIYKVYYFLFFYFDFFYLFWVKSFKTAGEGVNIQDRGGFEILGLSGVIFVVGEGQYPITCHESHSPYAITKYVYGKIIKTYFI